MLESRNARLIWRATVQVLRDAVLTFFGGDNDEAFTNARMHKRYCSALAACGNKSFSSLTSVVPSAERPSVPAKRVAPGKPAAVSENVLYSFKGGMDGSGPSALIDVNGTLFGTTPIPEVVPAASLVRAAAGSHLFDRYIRLGIQYSPPLPGRRHGRGRIKNAHLREWPTLRHNASRRRLGLRQIVFRLRDRLHDGSVRRVV